MVIKRIVFLLLDGAFALQPVEPAIVRSAQ
jgi:hypothetical protein